MSNKKNIAVAGDVSIDVLKWRIKSKEENDDDGKTTNNWELYEGFRIIKRPGGALLLAEMLSEALAENNIGFKVLSPKKLEELKNSENKSIIRSLAILEEYEKSKVYRVEKFCGFSGPDEGTPLLLPVVENDEDADIVVLDDAGNGFREEESMWPNAIKNGSKPLIVLKMSRPLGEGKLWKFLQYYHKDRLLVIITANDLRECKVNISRSLSWEKTAEDFIEQIENNVTIDYLKNCKNLIVRFGMEGAIFYHKNAKRDQESGTADEEKEESKSILYFDPKLVEGGLSDDYQGKMQGFGSAFTAALVSQIAKKWLLNIKNLEGEEWLNIIKEGVEKGVISYRRLFLKGFGKPPEKPDYPGKELFNFNKKNHNQNKENNNKDAVKISSLDLYDLKSSKNKSKTILESKTKFMASLARDYVISGKDYSLSDIPIGHFGDLKTADRAEIESYQSIKNLLKEYINKDSNKPFSIAVFGPPGSGKSFGVTQLAKSVTGEKVKEIEFNVSQFNDLKDLTDAFHKVRDSILKGKIPLVFFDEFDSAWGNVKLGWLKYFLAPMQDGEFKDGESMHPIGKSIFVFAGGTKNNFQEFSREKEFERELALDDLDDNEKKDLKKFRDAKGTDFVSRLRGHVNILGPDKLKTDDNVYIIRRAMILRSMLEKVKNIVDSNEKVRIDERVLMALLKIPKYKHGVRSIKAIIDMSSLTGKKKFEQSSLPPANQLEMHLDEDLFSKMVLRDVWFYKSIDNLAKQIHRNFLKEIPPIEPKMENWENIPKYKKESNRKQALDIPKKLKLLNYDYMPFKEKPPELIEFSKEEVEELAIREHGRFVEERKASNPKTEKPASQNLISEEAKEKERKKRWKKLSEKEKNKDRSAVRIIPRLLAKSGFEIFPKKSPNE
jgi:hypothetical protein